MKVQGLGAPLALERWKTVEVSPDGFFARWANERENHLLHLRGVTVRGNEIELTTRVEECVCPSTGHLGATALTYVYSLADLAKGRAEELVAAPVTAADMNGFVEFLTTRGNDWSVPVAEDLNAGRVDAVLETVPADVVSALMTLQHVAGPDAPHTVRALTEAGFGEVTVVSAAVLAGLSPREAVAMASEAGEAGRGDLLARWEFLAAMSGRFADPTTR